MLIGISAVVGSGIFLLPGIAAEQMGPAAIVPMALAGLLCALIALCFAEAGGRFSETGGAYLFAREAFGSFVGFSVGWMAWWVRLIAWAALANGFALALVPLVGGVPESFDEVVVTVVVLGLSAVNFRGAKLGAALLNVFTVAKLLPFVVFVGAGVFYVSGEHFTPFAPHGYGSLADTTLMVLWAFVGFELLAIPAGEMREPRRMVPLAFLIVMGTVTVLYASVFLVASGTYGGLAGSENPIAEAARSFLGPVGGTIIAVGIAVSIFGTLCASALVTPRCVFALAERGEAPAALAAIHSVHRTPSVAIGVSTAIVLTLALSGSFEELAVISVVARFFQYIPTCGATLVFRHRDRKAGRVEGGFRLPLGPTIPVLATLLCIALLVQTEPTRLLAGSGAFALGIPFYLVFARRPR